MLLYVQLTAHLRSSATPIEARNALPAHTLRSQHPSEPMIVDRIRKQLEQPDGLTPEAFAPLADEFNAKVADVNNRLADCVRLLRRGLRSEAIQRSAIKPDLLELATQLDFPEIEEWIEILQFYGIAPPSTLDRDAIQQLNEAFVEEQPLEELLREHRRLAIGRAPLAWRLRVLRRIATLDPLNSVWKTDQAIWESVRLKQLPDDVRTALAHGDVQTIQSLLLEMNDNAWLTAPPPHLVQECSAQLTLLRNEDVREELTKTADKIHSAYSAGDHEEAKRLNSHWQNCLKSYSGEPPRELLSAVEPAFEWLENLAFEKEQFESFESRVHHLNSLLHDEHSDAPTLKQAYYEVEQLGFSIDPLLQQRYESRVSEIELRTRRRTTLMASAIAGTILLCLGAGSLWYIRTTHSHATRIASDSLQQLIDQNRLQEAKAFLDSLEQRSPSIFASPSVTLLSGQLSAKTEQETERSARTASLIQDAEDEDDSLDIDKILAADRAAQTESEKLQVQKLRRRWELAQSRVRENQFQAVKQSLQELDLRIDAIQSNHKSADNNSELIEIANQAKKLALEFPKSGPEAQQMVALTANRALQVRESMAREQQNDQINIEISSRIAKADSLADLETEYRRFVTTLPSDSKTSSLRDALEEASLWKTLNEFSLALSSLRRSGASSSGDDAKKLLEIADRAKTVIAGLPEIEYIERLRDLVEAADRTTKIADELKEELENSVFHELVTVIVPSDPRTAPKAGKRRFLQFQTRLDYASDLTKQDASRKIILPIVSDSNGAVSSEELRGKLTLLDEPRASVRRLVNTLQKGEQAQSNSRPTLFTELLASVVRDTDLDARIKEVLVSRICIAIQGTTKAQASAFAPLADALQDGESRRELWHIEQDFSTDLPTNIQDAIRKSYADLRAQTNRNTQLAQNAASERLVWIGSLQQSSQKSWEAQLNRPEPPDGALYLLTRKDADPSQGQLLRVGQISQSIPSLSVPKNEFLEGRPLFWQRDPPTRSGTDNDR